MAVLPVSASGMFAAEKLTHEESFLYLFLYLFILLSNPAACADGRLLYREYFKLFNELNLSSCID